MTPRGNGIGNAWFEPLRKTRGNPDRWPGDPDSILGRMLGILRRGRAVDRRDLADQLWREGERPPSAMGVIQSYVTRLRQRDWPIETVRSNLLYLDPRRITGLPVGITVMVTYPGHGLHGRACFVTGEPARLKMRRVAGLDGAAPVLDLGVSVPVRTIGWRDTEGTVFALSPAELAVIPPDHAAPDHAAQDPASAIPAALVDVSRETGPAGPEGEGEWS